MTEQPDATPEVAPEVGPGVDEASAPDQEVDTLAVAVAELRPALEAILMVSDEPLATVRLASVVGHPVEEAALETLSVVAYKQPVSRARVSAVRGVNVDGVMRTLLARGLVEEAGQDEQSGANLYRTTSYFLERIGITSLDELPELAPYLPDMDDLEDELASVAGLDAPEPAPEAPAASGVVPGVVPAAHRSPHSGAGTEPDGGTEVS